MKSNIERVNFVINFVLHCTKKSSHGVLTFIRRSNKGGASSNTFIFTDTAALDHMAMAITKSNSYCATKLTKKYKQLELSLHV